MFDYFSCANMLCQFTKLIVMQNSEITITVNGKTHQFKAGDLAAFKSIPWSERKQLIDLLESIKQAEFVQADNKPTHEVTLDSTFNQNSPTDSTAVRQHVRKPSPNDQFTPKGTPLHNPQLDPQIKASEQDVNDLMHRLIVEQKKHHKSIPDKSIVIKLLLAVFVVIILVAMIT